MRILCKLIDGIALWMQRFSGLLLVMMMVTVVADVATRSLYDVSDGALDLTFFGGIEMVSFGLLFCILFSLPYCVDKGQVEVDLFTQGMSPSAEQLVSGLYTLGFAALGLAMSWRFFHAYEQALTTLEATQDLLIPLAPIYLAVSAVTLMLGIRSLRVSLERMLVSGRNEPVSKPVEDTQILSQGESL